MDAGRQRLSNRHITQLSQNFCSVQRVLVASSATVIKLVKDMGMELQERSISIDEVVAAAESNKYEVQKTHGEAESLALMSKSLSNILEEDKEKLLVENGVT